MPKAREIGAEIKLRRTAKGMTQADLAHEIGITTESLSRAERGTIQPTVRTLSKIASALGTTLDVLAGVERGPVPQPEGAEPPELQRLQRMLARLDRRALRRILGVVELLPARGRGARAR